MLSTPNQRSGVRGNPKAPSNLPPGFIRAELLIASIDQGVTPETKTLGELQTAISAQIRAHYRRAEETVRAI